MTKSILPNILPERKIGFVSFTDPRSEVKFVNERESYMRRLHTQIIKQLSNEGFIIIDPLNSLSNRNETKLSISRLDEIEKIAKELIKENISAIFIGCFTWNEPNLPLELAKKVHCPIALITTNNPKWPGVTAATSTGASFWQNASTNYIKKHERFLFSENNTISPYISWAKAMCTLNHLKTGKLLLWGGSPALNMEHLNDDIPYLKRFIINDILIEDQYTLIKKSEEIIEKGKKRITDFLGWLTDNGCKITYDNTMINDESLVKQIALYIASRDLIQAKFNQGEKIIGVSIKCQPELSVLYGVTACLLPAFLPFTTDNEGTKPILPTVCEGDIKGLLTSVILYGFQPTIPPLFGDIKTLMDEYFVIANCGASSVFFAGKSLDPKISLAQSSFQPQCQGKAGASVSYNTARTDFEATYAKLCKVDCQYYMQAGLGKIVDYHKSFNKSWGSTWPHTAVELRVEKEQFLKVLGTNHLSLTFGNFIGELKYICKLLGIPLVRIDNSNEIENFLDKV